MRDDGPRIGPAPDCSPLVPIYCACGLFGLLFLIALIAEKLQ